MADRIFIADHLQQFYDELEPEEFYRSIFPSGELESRGEQEQGKYNAIAVELLPKGKSRNNARRYILTDDLFMLDRLLKSENFIIVSPVSYIGKSRQANNARFIYALAIDLDGIAELHHLADLLHQIEIEHLPRPTYMVWSGTGLHLYYQFKQPLPCFKNINKQLAALKDSLTKKIWNGYVTELSDKPQLQSLFQGFRLVGGVTKGGNRTKAFLTGDPVDIEYLNEFVPEQAQVKEFAYKSNMTLKEAAAKYPEWYQTRIVEKKPKGTWTCKRDLYDWWKRRLIEIEEGHRYYGIMCLSIYAKKSGIDREELEKDAFAMVDRLDRLTTVETNHFTREDVLAALEMFNDNYYTFPIDTISQLTNLRIEKNKRNKRKQEQHLEFARGIRDLRKKLGEDVAGTGRPKGSGTKEKIINEWRQQHPNGSKADCIRDTGISKPTVYKYWD